MLAILLSGITASFAQEAEDRLYLARLFGYSHFVLENDEMDRRILETFLSERDGFAGLDFNELIDQMIPKAPKSNFKLIDTARYLMVANPQHLIDHPDLNELSKAKLISNWLGKGKGRKLIKKEIHMLPDPNPQEELNQESALRSFLRLWSGIEYYYPHQNKLRIAWEKTFHDYIDRFLVDSIVDLKVYDQSFIDLMARINDGHIDYDYSFSKKELKAHNRSHKKKEKKRKQAEKKAAEAEADSNRHKQAANNHINFPALKLKGIGDRLFVERLLEEYPIQGMEIGDEVISINGLSPADIKVEYADKKSYGREEILILDMNKECSWVSYFGSDSLVIRLKDKEESLLVHSVDMEWTEFYDLMGYNEETSYDDKSNEYVYLNVAIRDKKEFKAKLKRAAKNDLPLIIDCRNYPQKLFVVQLPKYLNAKPKVVSKIFVPLKNYPGVYSRPLEMTYFFTNTVDFITKALYIQPQKWNLFYPLTKKVKGPIYVLQNENSMSWGESMIMLIKRYGGDRVMSIGRNTNGANGNVGVVVLSAKREVIFTHYKLEDHQGRDFQNRGIPPDLYVEIDVPQADQDKQDKILQTALREIRKQAVSQ